MAAGPPSARSGLAFGILGPLEVWFSENEVPLAGSRQRALLAYLLLHANAVVSSERLIDELFGDEPPDNALNSVHTGISRLRRQLAAAGVTEVPILTRAPGYVLEIDRDQLDLHRFEDLLDQGRQELASGDPSAAAETLHQALDLLRGSALADLSSYEFARTEAARLEELRLAALSARIEADLALGRQAEVIGELELLTAQHPLQERLREQLMLALYRSGRQADALQVYQDTRRELISELGLEPGKPLQQLEQAILTQDPALDAPPRRPAIVPAGRTRRLLMLIPAALVIAAGVAVAFFALLDDSAEPVVVPANSVAAIDPATNRVTDVVGVGSGPGPLSTSFGAVWASNRGDSTVTRIDPATARVTRVIRLDRPANGLATGGGFLWAFASDHLGRAGAVDRIDPRYGVVVDTARIRYVHGAGGVAFGDNAAWVAPPLGLLTRLDRRTNEPVATVDTGGSPTAVAFGADSVWVAHPEGGTVVRIDPDNALVTASIPVGSRPVALVATSRSLWVVDDVGDSLVEVDSRTNTVRGSVAVGARPSAVAVGAGAVWVANAADGTVTRVDPETRAIDAVIRVGGAPRGVVVAGGRLWVSVAPAAATESASDGGVLRATAEGPLDTLDPALAYSALSWQIGYATCLKLVNHPDRPSPAGSRIVPDAATGVPEPVLGGTRYVFRIRPGLRFSPPSDQPVTAQTFKETLERAANPRLEGGLGGVYLGDIVGMDAYQAGRASHVAGIRAKGNALEIRLRGPAPDLLARLAMPFFCAVPTGTPVDPQGVQVIPSAGPYYIATYEPERTLVLRRNPGYKGPRPQGVEEIQITLGVPRSRGRRAVEQGESDYALDGIPPGDVPELRRMFAKTFFESPQIHLAYIALNTSRPLFSQARLRQAAALAVDRRELALGGAGHASPSGVATDQYLPPGMPGFQDVGIYPLKPDLRRVRRLVGDRRARFGVLYACNLPFCARQAAIVARNLREIGIGLAVRQFAIPELIERLGRRDEPFDVAISPGWFADFLDPAQYLNFLLDGRTIRAEQNSNFAYFVDEAYIRKLARIETLTGVRRVLAYGDLDVEAARDSAPLIAYANATSLDLFSERVGCQAYNPAYGMSLAALCLRKRTD